MGISHLLRGCIFCGSTSLNLQYTNELCDANFVHHGVRPSTEGAPLRSFLQQNNTQEAYFEENNLITDVALPPVQRREVRCIGSLPDRQSPWPTVHLPVTGSSQLRTLWGSALGNGGRCALLNLQRTCDMMAALVPASFVCVDVMGADHHVSCTLAVAGSEAAEGALTLGQPRVRTGRESTEWTIRLPLPSSSVAAHVGTPVSAAAVHIDTAAAAATAGGGLLEPRVSNLMTHDSNNILNTVSSAASAPTSAGRAPRGAAATLPTAPHHSTSSSFPRRAAHPSLASRNTASADGSPPPNTLLTSPHSTQITPASCNSPWRRRARTPPHRASLASLPNQRMQSQLPSAETTPRQQRTRGSNVGAMDWVHNERNSCPQPQTQNAPRVTPRGSAAISDRGIGGGHYRSGVGCPAFGDSSGGDVTSCLEPLPPHIRDMAKLYGDAISSIWAVPLYDVQEVTEVEEGMAGARSTGSGWHGAGTTAAAATEAEIVAEVQAAVAAVAAVAASEQGRARRGCCPERRVIGVLYMFGSTHSLFCPSDRSRFRAAVLELSSYVTEGCLQLLPDLAHRLALARDPLVAAEVTTAALVAVFAHRMQGMGRVRVYPAFLRQRNPIPTATPTPTSTPAHQLGEPFMQNTTHHLPDTSALTPPHIYRPPPHHTTSSPSPSPSSITTTPPTRDLILMLPPPAAPPPPGRLPPPGPLTVSSADLRQQEKAGAGGCNSVAPASNAVHSTPLQTPLLAAPGRALGAKDDVSAVGAVMQSSGSDAVGREVDGCADSYVGTVLVVDTPTAAAADAASYGEYSGSTANTGAAPASRAIQLSATSAFFASLGFPLSQFASESYDDRTSGDVSDGSDVRGGDSFQTAALPQPRALAAEGTLMAAAAAAARSRACRGMMLYVASPPPRTSTATVRTLFLQGGGALTTALTANLDVRLCAVGTAMWAASTEPLCTVTLAGGITSASVVAPQSSSVRDDGRDSVAVAAEVEVASQSPEDVRQLPGQSYHVLAGIVRTAEGAAEGATALWPGVYLTFSESLRPELVRELQASLDALLLLIGSSWLAACASETTTQELAVAPPPPPQQPTTTQHIQQPARH